MQPAQEEHPYRTPHAPRWGPARAAIVAGGLAILVAGASIALARPGAGGDLTPAGAACYALTTNVGSGSGTIKVIPSSFGACPDGQYAAGYMVSLAANPGPGYVFSSWSGTDNDGANPTTVTMNADRKVTANFVSNCYALTTNVGTGSGSVKVTPTSAGGCPTGQYSAGYMVTLTANPAAGYAFNSWSGTDNNGVNPTTVTMNGDRKVTANFAYNCHTLTTNVGSGSGSIQVSPISGGSCPSGQYPPGYMVTLLAVPASGFVFDHWTGADNNANSATTVTMNGDRKVTAYFASTSGSPTSTPAPTATPTPTRTSTPTPPPTSTPLPTESPSEPTETPSGPTETPSGPTETPSEPTETPTAPAGPTPTEPGPTTAPSATPTRPPPTPNPAPAGDVDCSGGVNSIDAVLVLQVAADLIPVAVLLCGERGDVDGDGRLTSLDAALILQRVAGLLTSLSR